MLLFEDECSLSNTATIGYKWGKKGRQPQVPCKQSKRERLTLFGSYNYESGQMSVNFAEMGNSRTFKKHLKKIRSTYKGHSKIIMVLDNVRFHHARHIKEWLSGQDQLELFFLPPYSPDLNPIEQAFAKLKALLRTAARRTVDALWRAIGQALDAFSPAECARYFAHAGYVPPIRETL